MADHPPIQPASLVAGVPDDVLTLIIRYYDSDIDRPALDQLRSALMQIPSARDTFIRWGLHSEYLKESLSPNYQAEGENVWAISPDTLMELARFEASVDAPLVHLHHFKAARPIGLWLAGAGALAAVLALAITLILVFQGNGNPAPSTTASSPDTPAIQPAHVATLTASHNAQWAQGALAPGSSFKAGQRLTLTAGFAEITTNRGAIAILQAPATIQLTDNDNALRLHVGKLVGLCETQSSKGFTVHTRYGDIVDLGTEFGIEVTEQQLTTTVFTGEVVLKTPDHPMLPLTANQTATLAAGDAAAPRIEDQLAPGFTRKLPDFIDGAILAVDFNLDQGATERGFVGQNVLSKTHATTQGHIQVTLATEGRSKFWDRKHEDKQHIQPSPKNLYQDYFTLAAEAKGSFGLTLSGEGIKPDTAYRLTFYVYDYLGGERATTIRPAGTTNGPRVGPIGVGPEPTSIDQHAGSGVFTSDAEGKLTFTIGDAESISRLNGFMIALP